MFWVHASSIARFMDSYKRIASEYQLSGRGDPTVNVLQLVQDWLDTKCPFDWFMVVDNVDDRAGFLERSEHSETSKALCEYVPQSTRGTILYTTRSRDIGFDLSPDKDPIMVKCLGFDDAGALLGETLISDSSKDDQLALFDILDYLPLAISQAAAFMIKRRKGVAEYLILIRDESTRSQILSRKGHHHGRAERSSESVVSTWWVTFRSIKRENPRAAELLAMMSLLDRHAIPVSMLQNPDEGIFGFEEAIGLLEDFSLITTFSGATLCNEQTLQVLSQMTYNDTRNSLVFGEMHGLVQESTKAWLSQSEANAAQTATKTLRSMGRCFLVASETSLRLCDLLYPHVNASLNYNTKLFAASKEQFQESPHSIIGRAEVLEKMSIHLQFRGKFEHSERDALLAIEIRRTYLGEHDETTLDSLENYATTLFFSTKWKEARDVRSQVLHTREGALGYQSTQTFWSLSQLGKMLADMGNLKGAERLLCRSLLGQRQIHLKNPENKQSRRGLISTMTSLASVFMEQGEHQHALNLLYEAYHFDTRRPTHPSVFWNISIQLVECYCQFGKYEFAHGLIEHVSDAYRGTFDSTNPVSFRPRRELATLLWAEGRCDEAEELLENLFGDWVKVDDSDDKMCTSVLRFIADMQYSRGKFEEAEETFERGLQIVVDGRQEGSPDRAYFELSFREGIRQCQEIRGQLEEAKACMLPSELKSTLDREGAPEAKKWRHKGKNSMTTSRFEKSVAASVEKLQVRTENPGRDDDDTQKARYDLAYSLYKQQRYEESYELGQVLLAREKRTKGWRNRTTQTCVMSLARNARKLRWYAESEELWRQLLHWQNYQFKRDQEIIFRAYNAIAWLMKLQADFKGAEEAYRSALAVPHAHLKNVDPREIVQTPYYLGLTLFKHGKFEEAEAAFSQAYDYSVAMFGSYDTDSIDYLICLTESTKLAGNSDRASELYHLLGVTIALPSDGEEEDFDESACESDYGSVTMASLSDGEEEDFNDDPSENDHDSDSSD